MNRACRVCGVSVDKAKTFTCFEMMFGTRESFEYVLCDSCGCLQISDIPADLARHYPSDYYSSEVDSRARIFLKGCRLRFDLGGISLLGLLMSRRFGPDSCAQAIRVGNIQKNDRVLDLGGGAGSHLRPMRSAGFRNLLCVDPFVQKEFRESGLEVRRASVEDVEGQFRLIMMHHSFEHMIDPNAVLAAIRHKLADNGVLLVRIPLLGYGWREYGIDWIELDAPRHLYLHSKKSFTELAERNGFEVLDVTFDSTDLEMWGSEQYAQGISLFSAESHGVNPATSRFSAAQIQNFREKIQGLNERGESGRAAFVLRKNKRGHLHLDGKAGERQGDLQG